MSPLPSELGGSAGKVTCLTYVRKSSYWQLGVRMKHGVSHAMRLINACQLEGARLPCDLHKLPTLSDSGRFGSLLRPPAYVLALTFTV